ncbi:hypothetical protein [Micromonospora sp. CA-244673]|uniref:hypothetical protein n=1 Tax=Micromonospora sp. CA-244673 TaxID=3239958 RepID=UPI003D89CEC7
MSSAATEDGARAGRATLMKGSSPLDGERRHAGVLFLTSPAKSNVVKYFQEREGVFQRIVGRAPEVAVLQSVGSTFEVRSNTSRFIAEAKGTVRRLSPDVVVDALDSAVASSQLIEFALEQGCAVVTTSSQAVGCFGPVYREMAYRAGTTFHYDACTGIGFPVGKVLGESLAGDEIGSLQGILCWRATQQLRDSLASLDLRAPSLHRQATALWTGVVETVDEVRARAAAVAGIAFSRPMTSRDVLVEEPAIRKLQALKRHPRRAWIVTTFEQRGAALQIRVSPEALEPTHPLSWAGGQGTGLLVQTRAAGTLTFVSSQPSKYAEAGLVFNDVVAAASRRSAPVRTTE